MTKPSASSWLIFFAVMGRVCSIFGDKGGQELSAIQQQQLDDLSKRFPLLGLMMGRAPGPSANQFSTAPLIVPIILPLPNVDGRDGFFDEFFDKFDKFVCKDKHKDPIHNSHGHYEGLGVHHYYPHHHHPHVKPPFYIQPHSFELDAQPEPIFDDQETQESDDEAQGDEKQTTLSSEDNGPPKITTPLPHLPGHPSVHHQLKPNSSKPYWWSLFTNPKVGGR